MCAVILFSSSLEKIPDGLLISRFHVKIGLHIYKALVRFPDAVLLHHVRFQRMFQIIHNRLI